jgi:hypothetical protein
MAAPILHAATLGGGKTLMLSINSIRAVDLVGRVCGVSICAFPQMERLRLVPFAFLMLLLG